ncbi:uncharacterized protein PG998_014279 [Apiospora kogelbergensis]|uniref:uncharacterized protein n=1 Tax=Apiospora kogelbergensis TaxID=1337665 RepID=UPI00312E33E7
MTTSNPNRGAAPNHSARKTRSNNKHPPALRWLGVHIDRQLKFRQHVQIRAAKGMKVANHIKALAATRRGPPAAGHQKAVRTVILPILLYGHEAWYRGRTHTARKSNRKGITETGTRLGGHVEHIHKALIKAARAVLPVWRTVPNDTLFGVSGLPTARVALEDARLRFAVRLRTVHEGHPLAARAEPKIIQRGKRAKQVRTPRSNLQHTALLLPYTPRTVLYAPRYKTGSRRNPTGGQKKDAATEAFKAWFEQQDPWNITVFSDGSQTKEGLGYGYVVFEGQEKIAEGKGGMDKCGVVFDAEALGALRGLQKAVELAPNSAITICADNTAAIWSVQKDAPTTSQWVFIKIHELMDWHNISIKWSPGHKEIQGNEMADELAKSGALHGPKDPDSRPTAAGLKSLAKSMIRDMANNWWPKARYSSGITNAEILYKPGKCLKVLEIPRAHLGWYMQTITAHGDYAWYHRRFEHEDAELHCPCSYSDYSRIARSVQHMVCCPGSKRTLQNWPKPPKPGPRPDGTQWADWSWPMRLHNLQLSSGWGNLTEAYWLWLLRNPRSSRSGAARPSTSRNCARPAKGSTCAVGSGGGRLPKQHLTL